MSTRLLEVAKKRAQEKKFSIEQFAFPKQLSFIQDPARYRTALCGRRAGKSTGCAGAMLATAMSGQYCNVVYATLARTSGKRIIWPVLKALIKEYKIKCKIDNTELTIEFENGSTIYLVGCKDASEIEKLRGLSIKLAVIDEAQAIRESIITSLIDDILAYAVMDVDGSICLIGTPGPVASGYFFEATAGKNETWSRHKWLSHDNPWIKIKSKKDPEQLLAEERKRKGIDETDPTYRREALAQWVTDLNALVIKFNATRNLYATLPPGNYDYVLGADIGFVDSDALAVLAYSHTDKHVYLVEEIITEKQDITSLANQIKALDKRYNFVKMVMDAGALGKKIQDEIRSRHGLNIEAAEKTQKYAFIELMNADLKQGIFKVFKGSRFEEDSYKVEWDRDTPGRLKISDRFHSDILDAALYAWRFCKHFYYEPPVEKKLVHRNSNEWAAQYEAQLMATAEANAAGDQDVVDQDELEGLYRDD
jgi:hypothetical protein